MSIPATLAQASHTLTILSQQDSTADDLKTLHNGYLADLIKSIQKGEIPSRSAFREAIGLDPLSFNVTVTYDTPFQVMLGQAGFINLAGLNIPALFTEELSGEGTFKHHVEILPIGFEEMKGSAHPDVLVRMLHQQLAGLLKKDRLRFAQFAELAAFAKRFGTLKERFRLVSLGNTIVAPGLPVACLERGEKGVGVQLKFVTPKAVFLESHPKGEEFRALVVKL